MSKGNVEREPVTHDDLITLSRVHQHTHANADRNRLECKFRIAIKEARSMGVLAVDILTDLNTLIDPDTGERVCPPSLEKNLKGTILQLAAVEAKKDKQRSSRQTPQPKPKTPIGFVVEGARGNFLDAGNCWREVPVYEAHIHDFGAIEGIREISRTFRHKPRQMYLASKDADGKTALADGIPISFHVVSGSNRPRVGDCVRLATA